ncbi:M23 family metallopeptidase [Nitrobacter sp. TKz-YC02]|uniref:M23 family metallopeptidase n=1 Tax=Nitrobacter sp. TKz-YC02 TaxID=3398704 RepID=UPI003CF3890A
MDHQRYSLILAVAVLFANSAGSTLSLELELPIACEIGQTCFIQNYVDHDPSRGACDYMCRHQTYDKHDGTDFRLPSVAWERTGVAVRAAADGQVLRTRDGMQDVSVQTIGHEQIKGRECGNTVILAHADGFESIYCHLQRGSLRVKPGDTVKRGQDLGRAGLSGNTEFAHLHFGLRRNGKPVDPFSYGAPTDACGGGTSLWAPRLASALSYRPFAVLNAGFASHAITSEEVEAGDGIGPPPSINSDIVAYVRAIGLETGDVQQLTLTGPGDRVIAQYTAPALANDMAQYTSKAGRKRPEGEWPHGTYRATYRVERSGVSLIEKTFELQL